jgi:hypothetical protein
VAQDAPKVDVFGGFAYLNYEALTVNVPSGSITEACTTTGYNTACQFSPTPTVNFTPRMGLYGWNGSVTVELTPWIGFTTDFSGTYSNATDSIKTTLTATYAAGQCTSQCTNIETYQYAASEPRIHTFLFGPQFTFPAGKVKAYGRFLAGGMNDNVSWSSMYTSTGESVAGGEPLYVNSGNYFAMACGGGVDYPVRKKMSWRVGADYLTSTGAAQNHVRVVSGLVWRLGK